MVENSTSRLNHCLQEGWKGFADYILRFIKKRPWLPANRLQPFKIVAGAVLGSVMIMIEMLRAFAVGLASYIASLRIFGNLSPSRNVKNQGLEGGSQPEEVKSRSSEVIFGHVVKAS